MREISFFNTGSGNMRVLLALLVGTAFGTQPSTEPVPSQVDYLQLILEEDDDLLPMPESVLHRLSPTLQTAAKNIYFAFRQKTSN